MAPSVAVAKLRAYVEACDAMPVVAPADDDLREALDCLETCAASYEARFDCSFPCANCGQVFGTLLRLSEHQAEEEEGL